MVSMRYLFVLNPWHSSGLYCVKIARHIGNFTCNSTTLDDAQASTKCSEDISNQSKRIIKVAILGTPNAGKSTLINKIVGHPVFSVSKKVHTTRIQARAAVTRGKTQVLFVDTPGLVSASEVKRHHLERSFEVGGLDATKEADMVGVVHDVGNKWTRDRLDAKIINILDAMNPRKKAFLIMNKVDVIRSKPMLLELIRLLTNHSKIQNTDESKKLQRAGWPDFAEVFLVSAKTGDGVKDIVDYLVKEAEEGVWSLPPGKITDQNPNIIISELVRGRLLDSLPEEVPYALRIETEYLHLNNLGEYIAVVLVTCQLDRHKKMLVAMSGRKIREAALLAESDARDALRRHVRLRIVVVSKEKPKEKYWEKNR